MAAQRETLSRHLSLRVMRDVYERLVRAARSETKSHLAARLIDEGLRAEAHPGIVFRGGPAGRRPGLFGGPDIWEVARVLRELRGGGEPLLAKTAELTGVELHQVRAAAGYYREFKEEIDAWIDQVDRDADDAQRVGSIREAADR